MKRLVIEGKCSICLLPRSKCSCPKITTKNDKRDLKAEEERGRLDLERRHNKFFDKFKKKNG